MYEDRTQNYDPEIYEEYLIHDAPIPLVHWNLKKSLKTIVKIIYVAKHRVYKHCSYVGNDVILMP